MHGIPRGHRRADVLAGRRRRAAGERLVIAWRRGAVAGTTGLTVALTALVGNESAQHRERIETVSETAAAGVAMPALASPASLGLGRVTPAPARATPSAPAAPAAPVTPTPAPAAPVTPTPAPAAPVTPTPTPAAVAPAPPSAPVVVSGGS